MTDSSGSKWHLVSTFNITQILDEFCASIDFTRDADEKYIYRIKDSIEQGEEMKKENWYRVTIDDGDVATYDGTTWVSNSEEETNLLPRTSYWIFGVEGDKIKGQWGSRGTGSGKMKIESILLSYIPNDNPYPQPMDKAPWLSTRGENCDLYALVKFDNNIDTLSFQSMSDVFYPQSIINFPSVSSIFSEFKAVFEETKKDEGVSFIDFSDIYYKIIGPGLVYDQNEYTLDYDKIFWNTVDISSWISYLKGIGKYNDDKSIGPFTDPKEAWNALFCFRQYGSELGWDWELRYNPTSKITLNGTQSYIDYAGRLSME
jgi:hypothetical protein